MNSIQFDQANKGGRRLMVSGGGSVAVGRRSVAHEEVGVLWRVVK